MTVLTHNLNLAENFQELAGRSTYFYVTREASPEVRYCEVYPCEQEEREDVGTDLVDMYGGMGFTVWGVEEIEEEVTPCDFEEFDLPVDPDVMPLNP